MNELIKKQLDDAKAHMEKAIEFCDNELVKIYTDRKILIKDLDVLIIATDWPEFRELAQEIEENLPSGALIMDGRRMLQAQYGKLNKVGYDIIAVGSSLRKRIVQD